MIRINEITSRECRAYLAQGGDLALIPVGSPERLGPHLPLGARSMVAEAIALLLAQQNYGLCFPLIPYSTLYDTFEQPGSIDMAPGLMDRYFWDLCDEVFANGFRRVVFVSFHEELYYTCNEYFQKHHKALAWITPNQYFSASPTAKALDAHGRELWRLVGCLHATNQQEMLEKVLEKNRAHYGKHAFVRDPVKEALDLLGRTGHTLLAGAWRFYPVRLGESHAEGLPYQAPAADAPAKAGRELLDWLQALSGPLSGLSDYQAFLDKTPLVRGL